MGLRDFFSKDSKDKEIGNFKDLENLVKKSNASLEYDIILDEAEERKYRNGIKIKKKNITLEGNGHFIDARSLSRMFWIESKTVIFKNIIFKNGARDTGGALLIDKESSIIFENCIFKNNRANLGGALYSNNNSNMEFHNCIFESNSSDTYGGAFVNDKSICTVNDCKFLNNNARRGGCIFNVQSVLKIENSQFEDNESIEYAGAIYSYARIMTRNHRNILVEDIYTNNLEVHTSNFYKNSANQAGAILSMETNTKIEECSFNNNSASGAGGAIFSNKSSLSIFSSKFHDNDAEDGGAIKADNGSSLNIIKTHFENNEATGKIGGGVIYCEGSFPSFEECTFKNNTSKNGGVIYNGLKGDCTFRLCTFESNSADENGGAIGSYGSDINIFSCTFKLNSVKEKYGGAIHNYESKLWIMDTTFEENLSNLDGGAISNVGSDSEKSILTLIRSTFENCSALNGPAIANYKGEAKIDSSTFEGNNGERGGAIFNGQVSEMEIKECIFDNNSADLGGAIDNWNKLNIENCSFEDNKALKYNAGAICHMEGHMKISNSRFENNTSQLSASVLYSLRGIVDITSSTIENNESQNNVILNQLSTLTIVNSCFESNNSGNSCILNGGNLTLNSDEFSDENEVILANKGKANINSCETDEDYEIHNCGEIIKEKNEDELIIESMDCNEFDSIYNLEK